MLFPGEIRADGVGGSSRKNNVAAVAVGVDMAIPELLKAGFEICHLHFILPPNVDASKEGEIDIILVRHSEIIA